jgi:proton-translocating NADH-quinone oxidoreductase chain L
MYLLPIYIPLMNFLLFFFFGKYFSKKILFIGCSINILINFLISIFILYEVCILNINLEIILCDWIVLDNLDISWGFYYDNLTSIMLVVINCISFAAHYYSIEYMEQDPYYKRFMSYLSLFTFFMIILVTGENLIQLFVGWEGVGISSYLLINFWYVRLEANKAALLAVLVNKIGDIMLMIAICIILYYCKTTSFGILNYMLYNNEFNTFISNTLEYNIINSNSLNINEFWWSIDNNEINNIYIYNNKWIVFESIDNYNSILFLSICLVVGMMAKSAQLGLHMWLPEAMEGPTPVSSLIHAATMVTAGIFLILRFSFFFEQLPNILILIFFLGALTSIFSTCIGVLQQDIKKIIAYSTCSQLAYMVAACGLSAYTAGFFHLYTHAFFKALLFLSSGYIIHIMNNEQDTRKLNNVSKYSLFFNIVFFTGSLSIAGFPFLSGFYSKENILDLALQSTYSMLYIKTYNNIYYNLLDVLNLLEILSLIGTAYYSCRICINISMQNKFNVYPKIANHYSELFTLVSLFLLFVLTLFIGYISYDFFLGTGNIHWISSLSTLSLFDNNYILEINKNNILLYNLEMYSSLEDILFLISLIGLSLFSFYSIKSIELLLFYIQLYNKEVYIYFITKLNLLNLILEYISIKSYKTGLVYSYKVIEKGYVESSSIFFNTNFLKRYNIVFKKESRYINHYLVIFFILIMIIINLLII